MQSVEFPHRTRYLSIEAAGIMLSKIPLKIISPTNHSTDFIGQNLPSLARQVLCCVIAEGALPSCLESSSMSACRDAPCQTTAIRLETWIYETVEEITCVTFESGSRRSEVAGSLHRVFWLGRSALCRKCLPHHIFWPPWFLWEWNFRCNGSFGVD